MHKKYPNRRSVRLRGYDYSQPGWYFITICTHNREHLFGKIVKGEMILNTYGQIAYDCWLKTAQIRPNVILDVFVVMPNHFHTVFAITAPAAVHRTGDPQVARIPAPVAPTGPKSGSVGAIIGGYKSMVAVRINRLRGVFGALVWQRDYHDHIIRNQTSFNNITQYIVDNPKRWNDDCYSDS